MRHPTVIAFWGFLAAVILWIGVTTLTLSSGGWSARHGMPGALLAGPGGWGAMHGWGRGVYVRNQTGGAPQSADVERAVKQWLAFAGNPRLKPGPVTEKDSSTFQADIVTADGSLVQRFNVDRNSGRLVPSED
jgi:hypothetical protein